MYHTILTIEFYTLLAPVTTPKTHTLYNNSTATLLCWKCMYDIYLFILFLCIIGIVAEGILLINGSAINIITSFQQW